MSGNATTTPPAATSDGTPVVTPPSGASAPDSKPAGADPNPAEDDDDHDPAETEPQEDEKSNQVKERIERAKKKAVKDLLSQLGVTSIEEAQAIKDKADKADLEKLTETERLQKERDDALKAAETERKTRERVERERTEEAARNFLKAEAERAGVDPDAMDLVMTKLEKHVEDNFDDDDELKSGAFKDFFAELRKDKKLWFKPTERPANTGGNSTTPQTPPAPAAQKSFDDMNEVEWEAYKRSIGLS